MNVTFLGATRTVTGSCYVLDTKECRFAVDCGLHQGSSTIEKRNLNDEKYDPANLEFIVISHAHIDHTGLLPRLVKKGFKGKIHCTRPTLDLLEIMLLDSANIQEMEAEWMSRKLLRKGKKPVEALYTKEDAEATLPLLVPHDYNEPFSPKEGVRINFKDAGHILGSAFIECWLENHGDPKKIVFSGDIGRPRQLIMRDPSIVETADFLFLESTYGNRNHKDEDKSFDELAEAIAYSYQKGEKVIIPAFAVERTQELLYVLYLLRKDGRLPADMPVFVDSPMAIRATKVFTQHTEYLDRQTRELLDKGENPFELPNLKFTLSADESKAINTLAGPAVVISASGMANAGRIKHHLKNNIWKPGVSVVFVGFQAQGTTGRRIVDGAESIRLFGEDFAVKARIFTINGFSAHAGKDQLFDWLEHFRSQQMEIFLVHGEYSGQKIFAEEIRNRFGFPVHIPDYLDTCTLVRPGEVIEQPRGEERVRPAVDWEYVLQDAEEKFGELKARLIRPPDMTWETQTDLRDRLLDLNRDLSLLISSVPQNPRNGQ